MAGRGRLSSLDLLPDEAQDDLIWALAELNQRRRTQADILFELNDRLEAKGLDTISRSAFSRKSVSLAKRANRLTERDHLYAGVQGRFTPEKVGRDDVILGEFVKGLIDEAVDRDDMTTKQIMELARAYKDIISGQKISAENTAKAKKEIGKVMDQVEAVVEASGNKDGLAVLKKIREDVYGIFE